MAGVGGGGLIEQVVISRIPELKSFCKPMTLCSPRYLLSQVLLCFKSFLPRYSKCLNVWTTDQWHQCYLRTWQKFKFFGPSQTNGIRNSGGGAQYSGLVSPAGGSDVHSSVRAPALKVTWSTCTGFPLFEYLLLLYDCKHYSPSCMDIINLFEILL